MSELYKLPNNLNEDIDAHESDVKRFLEGDLAPGIFKARRVPRGIYMTHKQEVGLGVAAVVARATVVRARVATAAVAPVGRRSRCRPESPHFG